MMKSDHMWYAAVANGRPGFFAARADLPGQADKTADVVAKWEQQGGTIVRVTEKVARQGLNEYFDSLATDSGKVA